MIGGSGVAGASIGHYVFDPYLLVQANVPQEIIRVADFASDKVALALYSDKVVKSVLELSNLSSAGNASVVAVSLVMYRMRLYAVNARKASWKLRCIFSLASTIWFTSFHTSGSTMMANKRNMVLETVAILFLVTRDDFPQPRRATSEPNEHVYGMLRMLLREFTVVDVNDLVNKIRLKMNSLFRGNLVADRSNAMKGYLGTLPDFLANSQAGSLEDLPAGPVNVDLEFDAVTQLWDQVAKIFKLVKSIMLPFLKLHGVDEGHGLSPFASDFENPSDLAQKISDFFKPAKRDMRDNAPSANVVENEEEDESVDGDDRDGEISDSYVEEFVKSMLEMDLESDDNGDGTSIESNTGNNDSIMGTFCQIVCHSSCFN